MADTQRIRVMLAEDQAMIRQGFRYIIDAQPDMIVVGEAADGNGAIEVCLRTTPDVVLMDIRMPNRTGIEATGTILKTLPETKVILLTTFDIQEYVFDGIRAGAVGYILKDAETRTLLDAIRTANEGGVVFRSANSGRAIAQALQADETAITSAGEGPLLLEPLTEREHDVLQQMAYGHRNAEIAATLYVSEGTVKTHVHHILQKFGVEDRTQAVVMAIRQHIVC